MSDFEQTLAGLAGHAQLSTARDDALKEAEAICDEEIARPVMRDGSGAKHLRIKARIAALREKGQRTVTDHTKKAWEIVNGDPGFSGSSYHRHRIATIIASALTAAVEAEREACEAIARNVEANWRTSFADGGAVGMAAGNIAAGAQQVAEAIAKRGDDPPPAAAE